VSTAPFLVDLLDIRVIEYGLGYQLGISTECILCQTCITVCPHNALKLAFGLDLGGKELLRERLKAGMAQGK
jgi:ferredoxin